MFAPANAAWIEHTRMAASVVRASVKGLGSRCVHPRWATEIAGGIAAGRTACDLEESFICGAVKYGETKRNRIQGKTIELKKLYPKQGMRKVARKAQDGGTKDSHPL